MIDIGKCNIEIFDKEEKIDPNISGRVIYHSYNDYGDGSSTLHILNLKERSLECISSGWTNVIDPMNAVWSDDGKSIVFMAIDKFNDSWELYLYEIGQEGNPINLTNSFESRDEDPKFYPGSNNKIVFKSKYDGKYHIETMDINTRIRKVIYSSTSMECSMPYYSLDGENIYFSGLKNNESNIYVISSLGGVPKKVRGCSDSGINEYYPITMDENGFFYTRPEPNDKIYFKNTKMDLMPVSMPFNELYTDNSDPCIVNSKYTIISRNKNGTYNLYICDNESGESWPLDMYNDGVNTCKNKLGAAYTKN